MRNLLKQHFINNINRYATLFLVFTIGVGLGAFTVNALSNVQHHELTEYLNGFLQLIDNQKVDSYEVFIISVQQNMKLVVLLWILGVSIIGIPFIFLVVGIRGFITGFCSGFVIKTLGSKGILFLISSVLPKEMVMVPCIIALAVNGVNFSLDIIKQKNIRSFLKSDLKIGFLTYCAATVFYSGILFGGVLLEAYAIPVIMKMIARILV